MLRIALGVVLCATPTFGPRDVQPLLSEGDHESWAKVGYLGESADGRVALVFEQGENENGSAELRVTFVLVDASGKLPVEKLSWSTTDTEALDPVHAWEERGAFLHAMLERANVHPGFKRFSADAAKKPKGLELVFGTDPAAAGPLTVKLDGRQWFTTEPTSKPRLEWKGVLNTAKGSLHFFVLQRLGHGAGPDLEFLARAAPAKEK